VLLLLDESLPRQLADELAGVEIRTVRKQGWSGLSNGELLRRAEAKGFTVFLTADQNLQYQQNLSGFKLGVIVIAAASNRIQDLKPLVPEILKAIRIVKQGEVLRVGS